MGFVSKSLKTLAGLTAAFSLVGGVMTLQDIEKKIIPPKAETSTIVFAWGRNVGTAVLWALGQGGEFFKGLYKGLSEDTSEEPLPSKKKTSSVLPKANEGVSQARPETGVFPGLSYVFTIESGPDTRVSAPLLPSETAYILKNKAAPERPQSFDIA